MDLEGNFFLLNAKIFAIPYLLPDYALCRSTSPASEPPGIEVRGTVPGSRLSDDLIAAHVMDNLRRSNAELQG
jgi:hypothetical protein